MTQTHFGFETVDEKEKAQRVAGVFSSVAQKYDVMNDLMSMGLHRLWKKFAIDIAAPRPGERVLDVAGGTADLSLAFARRGAMALASRTSAVVLRATSCAMLSVL